MYIITFFYHKLTDLSALLCPWISAVIKGVIRKGRPPECDKNRPLSPLLLLSTSSHIPRFVDVRLLPRIASSLTSHLGGCACRTKSESVLIVISASWQGCYY